MAKKIGKIKVTTQVRNTAIPKVPAVKKEITHEMIAKRAYEIWQSGTGRSEMENWLRAERELNGL
ncbi:MAG TPA: DUF2934 domain-containing protein [Tepidisphaeraceae bacterium]|nr:DUF2934 domain-containing protein [Tepidisphaeraceae bacterium]